MGVSHVPKRRKCGSAPRRVKSCFGLVRLSTMDTERKTGIVWSYRLPEHEYYGESFRGDFATRHEVIGHATTMANLLGVSEWEVRWSESMWTKHDEPTVCDYCGHEEYYLPLVGWTFELGAVSEAYCCDECYARSRRKRSDDTPDQMMGQQ